MKKENAYKLIKSLSSQGLCNFKEYKIIVDTLLKKAPCNFLVFSVGNDSKMWLDLNENGKTIFIEDQKPWIEKTKKKLPNINIVEYKYNTKRPQWKKLSGDINKLKMELPSEVIETNWDVIFVDGPAGGSDGRPGRMKSIYMSSLLGDKGCDIFIHDHERVIENHYSQKYLKNLLLTKNRMAHYIL